MDQAFYKNDKFCYFNRVQTYLILGEINTMKYILLFIISLNFFSQNYASVAKNEHHKLKPAEFKKFLLGRFLSDSFQVDYEVLGEEGGFSREVRRLYKESGFAGHIKEVEDLLGSFLGIGDRPIANNCSKNKLLAAANIASSVSTGSKKSALDFFYETHDKSGFPTNEYFSRLLRYMDVVEKKRKLDVVEQDEELLKYFRDSWDE